MRRRRGARRRGRGGPGDAGVSSRCIKSVWWGEFTQLTPRGSVALPSAFYGAAEHVASNEGKDDRMAPDQAYCRYSGTRSSSHAAAVVSQSSLPGGFTSRGQPGGTY